MLILDGWFRNVDLYLESPPALEIRSLKFFSLGGARPALRISCIAVGRTKAIKGYKDQMIKGSRMSELCEILRNIAGFSYFPIK